MGSIFVTILDSCPDMKTMAFYLHELEYSWVVKLETPQRLYSGHNTSLGHHTDSGPTGLGQYNKGNIVVLILPPLCLVPTGGEETGVFVVWSVPVASCQEMI